MSTSGEKKKMTVAANEKQKMIIGNGVLKGFAFLNRSSLILE